MVAEEKEGNGESRRVGRKKMSNEKGKDEQMNRTGNETFCSPSNPVCSKLAKHTPDLCNASLISNKTGLGGPHLAFRH